ncbi:MAG: hypothetical protein AAF563_09720 [Pseudomonadota bacterium]
MAEDTRAGILDAVSDWMKFLTIIALIAEAVILAAMGLTPTSHPLSAWYPVFMLGFLILIVVGFFVDRHNRRKSAPLVLHVGEITTTADPSRTAVEPAAVEALNISDYYVDMTKGYSFKRPDSELWSKPAHLSALELAKKVGVVKDAAITEEQFLLDGAVVPLGRMLRSSENIIFSQGDPLTIEMTDQTSNAVVDAIIERLLKRMEEEGEGHEEVDEAKITEFRRSMINPEGLDLQGIQLENSFSLMILDKSLSEQSPVRPTLGNIFSQHQAVARDPIDTMVANDTMMLWGTQNTLTNVLLNGTLREVSTYRMYKLVDSSRFVFLISIVWIPQSQGSIEVWHEMKQMIESFKVIDQ